MSALAEVSVSVGIVLHSLMGGVEIFVLAVPGTDSLCVPTVNTGTALALISSISFFYGLSLDSLLCWWWPKFCMNVLKNFFCCNFEGFSPS